MKSQRSEQRARASENENAKTKNRVWMKGVFLDYSAPWLENQDAVRQETASNRSTHTAQHNTNAYSLRGQTHAGELMRLVKRMRNEEHDCRKVQQKKNVPHVFHGGVEGKEPWFLNWYCVFVWDASGANGRKRCDDKHNKIYYCALASVTNCPRTSHTWTTIIHSWYMYHVLSGWRCLPTRKLTSHKFIFNLIFGIFIWQNDCRIVRNGDMARAPLHGHHSWHGFSGLYSTKGVGECAWHFE